MIISAIKYACMLIHVKSRTLELKARIHNLNFNKINLRYNSKSIHLRIQIIQPILIQVISNPRAPSATTKQAQEHCEIPVSGGSLRGPSARVAWVVAGFLR